jgi:hypothetical protein
VVNLQIFRKSVGFLPPLGPTTTETEPDKGISCQDKALKAMRRPIGHIGLLFFLSLFTDFSLGLPLPCIFDSYGIGKSHESSALRRF